MAGDLKEKAPVVTDVVDRPEVLDLNEKAALGSIFVDPERVLPLARRMGVTGGSFHLSPAREVFSAVERVSERGALPECLATCLELGNWPEEQPAWILYVQGCIEACPSAAFAGHYFRTLREAEATRELRAGLADAFAALEANPKRIWEVCGQVAELLRRMKAVQRQLEPFPPPQPIKADGFQEEAPR